MKIAIVNFLVGLMQKVLGPLIAFIAGRKSKEAEQHEHDAKVLKRQRDNNVTKLSYARKRMRVYRRRKR